MHFAGGFRFINVMQMDKLDFPTFYVNFVFFSETDNLDSLLRKNLMTRVKLMNSTLSSEIRYLGKGKALREKIDFRLHLDFSSEPVQKLGREVSRSILKLINQQIVFLGKLYDKEKKVDDLLIDKTSHTVT
jgi:hypothetical protein